MDNISALALALAATMTTLLTAECLVRISGGEITFKQVATASISMIATVAILVRMVQL